MIEEGLLERRGKWSANGTLSPIGHLLTLHSSAAQSVSMCICMCVCVWAIPSSMCAFFRSVYPHFHFCANSCLRSLFKSNSFSFHFWFCLSLAIYLFTRHLPRVLIPIEVYQCVILWAHQIMPRLIEMLHTLIITPMVVTEHTAINNHFFTAALLANFNSLALR